MVLKGQDGMRIIRGVKGPIEGVGKGRMKWHGKHSLDLFKRSLQQELGKEVWYTI